VGKITKRMIKSVRTSSSASRDEEVFQKTDRAELTGGSRQTGPMARTADIPDATGLLGLIRDSFASGVKGEKRPAARRVDSHRMRSIL